MNTAGIKEGDIVELDVRGGRAYAEVVKPAYKDPSRGRILQVKPLIHGGNRWLPTQFPTSRQIVGHYSKRKTRNGNSSS